MAIILYWILCGLRSCTEQVLLDLSRSFHKFLPNSLTDAWFVPPRGFVILIGTGWSNVSLSLGKNDSSENF